MEVQMVRLLIVYLSLSSVLACAPLPKLVEPFVGDMHAPVLERVEATGSREVRILFDEPTSLDTDDFIVDPPRTLLSSGIDAESLVLTFAEDLEAGTEFWIEGTAQDSSGNSTTFLVHVYGRNTAVPSVVINEFSCEGSSTHPDMVELKVLSTGNLAGLALYDGSPGYYDNEMIFPSVSVERGEYLLIHFKPQNIPEEIDERDDSSVSGGLDAVDGVRDFWVPDGDGIPNTTGALTLLGYPGGPLLDAVLYTTKTYNPEDELRGYGLSSQLLQAEEVVTLGGWEISGDFVIPQDGINPEDSTATRTICRSSSSGDSNHREDWHIVPTSESTFGSSNSDLEY